MTQLLNFGLDSNILFKLKQPEISTFDGIRIRMHIIPASISVIFFTLFNIILKSK